MATKTLKVNVTITISTTQSFLPTVVPCEIWPKINVGPFFIEFTEPSSKGQTPDSPPSLQNEKLGRRLIKGCFDGFPAHRLPRCQNRMRWQINSITVITANNCFLCRPNFHLPGNTISVIFSNFCAL